MEELLDAIQMPRADVLDQCESASGPSMTLLQRVSDHFEITFDDLIDDRIDEGWVRKPELAEKFLTRDGSKLRTSLPVIQWLENHYGEAPVKSLLRSLRIPNQSVRDPEQIVKLKLLCMLLRSSAARGLRSQNVFEMGLAAIKIPENAAIRESLAGCRNAREAYEYFFGGQGVVERFEKNYRYRIERMGGDFVTVSATPFEPRIFENGPDVIHDGLVSTYRWGVAAGVLGLMHTPLTGVDPVRLPATHGGAEHFRISWRPRRSQAADETASFGPSLKLL